RLVSALALATVLLLLAFAATAGYQARRIARERDVAQAEQRKAEGVVTLLTYLFSASNPRSLPGGGELTMSEFLERAGRTVAENQGLDTNVQARLKHVLVEVYYTRSQFEQARHYLEASLAQLRQANPVDDAAAADVLHDLARLAAR